MSSEENARLVQALYKAFNQHDFDRCLAMATPDIEVVAYGLQHTFRGPDGFREFMEGWASAIPDGKIEILNQIASDDGVAMECGFRGTHSGPLAGPGGVIPPTGRAVDQHFCEVYAIRNGKITRFHNYADSASLMAQLGLIPQPQAAGS